MGLRKKIKPNPGQYDYGLYNIVYNTSGSNGKLNLINSFGFDSHRSGWGAVMEQLDCLHSVSGIMVDSFIERTFGWMRDDLLREHKIPYQEPWIGFIHNPPGIPEWYKDFNKLQHIFDDSIFIESLKYCKGLYTLSNYLNKWVEDNIPSGYNILIDELYHPHVGTDYTMFCYEEWLNNKTPMILDIGTWLRKQTTLYNLNISNKIRKVKLWPKGHENGTTNRKTMEKFFDKEVSFLGDYSFTKQGVSNIENVSNIMYDYLLSRNIVFFDCWDTSANNTLVECIERTTPVLCPRLPAIIEYVGDTYPMLYENSIHASELLREPEVILRAHNHMKAILKSNKFTIDTFISDIKKSRIYNNI